jgi:hypothetical protein
MSEQQAFDPKTLTTRIEILSEIVETKTSQLNNLIEGLKRLDGYVLGSKESVEKIEKHIKQQKNELKELASQGKVSKEIFSFLDSVFNSMISFVKSVSLDAERLFFSKQGETVFLKQDIEKMVVLKKNHEVALKATEKNELKKEVEVKEEIQKVRPDKNPNTKIGRAAIDIAERKKKAKESSILNKENSLKKRGRKPKEV